MRIGFGLAKGVKNKENISSDSFALVERPRGGLSVILARGQGNDATAKNVGSIVVNHAAALVKNNEHDEKISAAVHDFLYETNEKRTPCTLSLMSIDSEEDMLLISRNGFSPVLVKTDDFDATYDESANPIGLAKHSKPDLCSLPITGNLIAVTFTDGLFALGKKYGRTADIDAIKGIIDKSAPTDAAFIAKNIAEYAFSLDKEQLGNDFTVAVLTVTEDIEPTNIFGTISASYDY